MRTTDTGPIKAIETNYRGYRFRSRLEARWATFFDNLGVRWQYEHEGYQLPSGKRYLPDFYLPDVDVLVEVKGQVKGAQRKQIVLWGNGIPSYAPHWGTQGYTLRPDSWFSDYWMTEDVVNYLWIPDGRDQFSIGVQIGAIVNSKRDVYLSSPTEGIIAAVSENLRVLGVTPVRSFCADSFCDALSVFFPCSVDQEKLIEATRHLGKVGVMLIGALHEFEAERFEPRTYPDSDVMRNDQLMDLEELLSGHRRLSDQAVKDALRAGMEARF